MPGSSGFGGRCSIKKGACRRSRRALAARSPATAYAGGAQTTALSLTRALVPACYMLTVFEATIKLKNEEYGKTGTSKDKQSLAAKSLL